MRRDTLGRGQRSSWSRYYNAQHSFLCAFIDEQLHFNVANRLTAQFRDYVFVWDRAPPRGWHRIYAVHKSLRERPVHEESRVIAAGKAISRNVMNKYTRRGIWRSLFGKWKQKPEKWIRLERGALLAGVDIITGEVTDNIQAERSPRIGGRSRKPREESSPTFIIDEAKIEVLPPASPSPPAPSAAERVRDAAKITWQVTRVTGRGLARTALAYWIWAVSLHDDPS